MSEQPQLFDPGPEDTGPLSVRQFMDRATWHGTKKPDWDFHVLGGESTVHHGTPTAALDRHRHHDGRDSQYYPLVSEHAQVPPLGDNEANVAEDRWRSVSDAQRRGSSLDESYHRSRLLDAKPEVQEGVAILEQGKTVPYRNLVEDPGSTSFVTPASNLQSVKQTRDFHLLPESAQRPSLTRNELFQQGTTTSRIRDHGVENPVEHAPQMLRRQAGSRSEYVDPEVL